MCMDTSTNIPHWWKIRIQSEGGPSASPIWAECDAAGGQTGSGTEDWDLGRVFFSWFFFMRFTTSHHGFKESADQWIFQTSWVKGSVCCVKSQKKRQHEESGGVLRSDTSGWYLSKQWPRRRKKKKFWAAVRWFKFFYELYKLSGQKRFTVKII